MSRLSTPTSAASAGIWIDNTFASPSAGMCLQAVYQAAEDPAICKQFHLEGVRPTCRAYYAARSAPPLTPLPPNLPLP
jgi:hypothetical protein